MNRISFFVDYFVKWSLLATLVGLFAGILSALFLKSLSWVTVFRQTHLIIIFFLPLAGLIFTFLYQKYGKNAHQGNNLVIKQAQGDKERIPLRLIPLVFFGTVFAHLFGASVGREGTAVQMGGSCADFISHNLKLTPKKRQILITAGMGAGFSSIFGTPLAGAIFAVEVLAIGKLETLSLYPVFLASIVANQTALLFKIHHHHFQVLEIPAISLLFLAKLFIAALCFGVIGGLFARSIALIKTQFKQKVNQPYLVIAIGGVAIALFGYFVSSRYLGLSLELLTESFSGQAHWYDFIGKFCLTVFSLGIGFQGGEVTPLFEIGATLGASLAPLLSLPITLLAALGYISVFSSATNTPIACLIMGVELFGSQFLVPLFFVIIISFLSSGQSGIYSAQIAKQQKINIFSPKNETLL